MLRPQSLGSTCLSTAALLLALTQIAVAQHLDLQSIALADNQASPARSMDAFPRSPRVALRSSDAYDHDVPRFESGNQVPSHLSEKAIAERTQADRRLTNIFALVGISVTFTLGIVITWTTIRRQSSRQSPRPIF